MPDKKKEISLQDIAADINDSDTTSASDVESALGKYVSGNAKSYAVSQLIHETGNPELDSEVSRNNNNYSGITWNKNFPDEWKGTPRPDSEGGNYVKFPTVDDWAREHAKLLKKDKGAGAPADATSIEDYAHRLKVNGYYKDPESVYAKSLKRIQAQRGEKNIADVAADINDDSAPDATQPAPAAPVAQQTPQQITNSVFGTQLDGSPIAGATQVPVAPTVPAQPAAPANSWENTTGLISDTPAPAGVSQGVNGNANNSNPAPVAPQLSQQEILNKTLGTQLNGVPIATAPVEKTAPEKTQDAVDFLAKDALQSGAVQPTTDAAHPDNELNQLTNPHGDPAYIANYKNNRMKAINTEYQQQLYELQTDPARSTDFKEKQALDAQFAQKKKDLEENAGHIIGLQLFNQEYGQNKPMGATANTATDAIRGRYEKDAKGIDNQIAATYKSEAPNGSEAVELRKQLNTQKLALTTQYDADISRTKAGVKYNPIQLGAKYAAAMGDETAKEDLNKLEHGQPIAPSNQYKYNLRGNRIIQDGTDNAVNEKAKEEGEAHADRSGDQLFENNKPFIVKNAADVVANAKEQDRNPISSFLSFVTPSKVMPNITREEIDKYGQQEGIPENALNELRQNPNLIPKPASGLEYLAKGALNTAAPIFQRLVYPAIQGVVGGEDPNQRFHSGWENESGLGAAIVGNTPSSQNSWSNIRGVGNQMMETIGNLGVFGGEVGGLAKGGEALGLGEKASEKLANFGVMAFDGYNDAYNKSLDIFGDKPEDEGKRKLYSTVNGLITGALFSISPKAQIVKNALGMESKSAESLIKEIQANNGMEFLQTKTGKEALASTVQEFGKEYGAQISLATAQKISEGIVDGIAAPERKQNMPGDVMDAAGGTAISMLLPSILGSLGHTTHEASLNAGAMFEMGTHPDQYISTISKQLQDGKISPQQAQASHDAILTMKNVVSNTPTENSIGEQLTPNQVKDYSYSLFQENMLQKKIKSLEDGAKMAGLEVDQAQLAPLKKRISEVQKTRVDILSKPVPKPVIVPDKATEEKPNSEPNPERSVANQADQSDAAGNQEKNNAENVNISEEPIPLSPDNAIDNSLTPKTTKNEKDSNGPEIGHGQESASIGRNEGEGQSEDNANSEGRNEAGRQDRELTETPPTGQDESAQEQPVVKQSESASSGSETPAKKPRQKKVYKGDADTIPVVVNPGVGTQDLGQAKGKPEEHTAEAIKEATIEHPDKPADVLVADHPEGESFNEAKDRFHSAVESIAKDAPDNSVVVTHSWGLKLLEAAHKVGWDHPNIAEEHQNGSTEPGDLVPYKTEDGKIIWFARHGETADNEKDLQRTNDTKLTDKGREQAANIAAELKKNGVTPSQIISSDLPRAKETADIISKEFPKEKPTEDATKINEQPQQESDKQSGEPEHARIEPKREQAPQPEAKNSDSNQRSQAPQVKPKRKGRKGWSLSAQLKRRSDVLSNEPRTIEEHILHTMLAMDDKHPEDKWRFKDVERDLPKNARNRDGASAETKRIAKQFTSVDSNMGIDEWADALHREIEDGHHPFGLNGMDSKDIGDMVKSLVSQFPSKTNLLEHLENLHKDVEPEDLSDEEKEYNASHQLAEATPERIEALGKSKSELEEHLHNEIADKKISESDISAMDNYLSHLPVDESGITNLSSVDPFSDEYQNMMKNLSHDGQVFVNRLLFESVAEDKDVPKIIKEKAQQNIEKNEKQSEQQPVASAEGHSGDEPEKPGENDVTRAGDSAYGERPGVGEREEAAPKVAEPIKRTPELALKRHQAHEKAVGELNDLRDERSEIEQHLSTEEAKSRPNMDKRAELERQLDAKDKEIADKVKEVDRRKRELDIQLSHEKGAKKITDFIEKQRKANKGMMLSSPVPGEVFYSIMGHFAKLYKELGNVRIAALRAVEWAKDHFKNEEGIEKLNARHIEDASKHIATPLEHEPLIRDKDDLESIRATVREIQEGDVTKEEAHQEIDESPISDKAKANLHNYIDWHTGGDTETQEEERRESNNNTLNDKNWIDEHQLSHSGGITEYISHKTEKDIYGDEAVKSAQKEYEATKIFEDLSRTGHDLFNQAQKKYAPNGEPLSEWGGKFLADLNNADLRGKDAGAKKVVGLATMAGELQGESKRLEMEMAAEKDVAKRNDLSNQKAKTDELLGKVQKSQTDLLHEASLTLNARRISRIFRNTHLYELYEKAILSDKQRKAKDNINEALDTGKVADKDIAPGIAPAAKPEKEALKEEAKASEARKAKESDQPKKKGIIKRIKEAATKGKKASKEEIRKNILSKEEKAALLNDILKEQKKTKC